MNNAQQMIDAIDSMITRGAKYDKKAVIYVDYNEGPFLIERARSEAGEVILEYSDSGVECFTSIPQEMFGGIRIGKNRISGLDEDEEPFRIVFG
jgi:hypothetical protein